MTTTKSNSPIFTGSIPKNYDEYLGPMLKQSTIEKELSEKYGAAPMVAPMRAVVSQAWK
jgi:hypothetical protein